MKTLFVILLAANITWAKNPADRNGLDSLLDSAISEQQSAVKTYEQTEAAKRYYQHQFRPSAKPEIVAIGDQESITVNSNLDLAVKKSRPTLEREKAIQDQQEVLLERLALEIESD